MSRRNPHALVRTFGDLRVRPKLIVLHNLFFLVLTCAAYFSLIPLFDQQVRDARQREERILRSVESDEARLEIAKHVRIAQLSESDATRRARWTLFIVLAVIYSMAVLALELAIMPLYVYRPLKRMLEADAATREGDREHELIESSDIMRDEIGQIMRSRNSTVEELRRHEDDLAAALRKLEDQDRLVSLGLLSASVAHEMNTPLAVLHGSIEKLEETLAAPGTVCDPHTLERLARMKRVTERLRLISASLLDFARPRKDNLEAVALRPIVDEAWGLVAIDEKAATVTFLNDVAAGVRVIGSAPRLIQVFVNLLRNALIAIETEGPRAERGSIEVRSRKFERNRQVLESITVEDNGRGIPAGVLSEIFDAFVSTRLDSKGTGLGLTVAEGIVTQHGGSISASNRPEGGARLEVCLPVAQASGPV